MALDVLSDVLKQVRLEGALFLNGEFREPWCVDAPAGALMAGALRPGAQQLAICHLVLEGRCWIRLRDGEALPLEAGTVAVLPQGDAHLIGSGLHHAAVDLDHVVQVAMPQLSRVSYGGEGDRSVVICGWFAFENGSPNSLADSLPRLFCSPLREREAGPWIEDSIRYVLANAAAQPGSHAVTAKVAEMLFVEALRAHVEALPAGQSGWLAGLRDPVVGRCLGLMHGEPARAWSVESLAEQVHVSRSVLAERFSKFVGVPPMQYLKQLRLGLAGRLLAGNGVSLQRVAAAVGYESEAAFSRAFKSHYGVPPGAWRDKAAGS